MMWIMIIIFVHYDYFCGELLYLISIMIILGVHYDDYLSLFMSMRCIFYLLILQGLIYIREIQQFEAVKK